LNTLGKLLELFTSLIFLKVVHMYGHTSVFIMVCHLATMAHFVSCRKQIIAKESAYSFISIFYRLHHVPKEIVSDKDVCWKILAKFYGKIEQ